MTWIIVLFSITSLHSSNTKDSQHPWNLLYTLKNPVLFSKPFTLPKRGFLYSPPDHSFTVYQTKLTCYILLPISPDQNESLPLLFFHKIWFKTTWRHFLWSYDCVESSSHTRILGYKNTVFSTLKRYLAQRIKQTFVKLNSGHWLK